MKEKNKKYTILLVDDDKFLLDMYSTKFTEKGFEVTAVFGAGEAVLKLQEGAHFDVIVTDIVMPVMDGFEFLSVIQKSKLAPDSRVVVLSNLGQQEDLDRAKKSGADGYIIKATATPSEVVKKVLEIVEEK